MASPDIPFSCAHHTAFVYDRGGKKRLGQFDPLTAVDWERTRDDISFANATVAYPSPGCRDLLGKIEPNRHELVVFREGERVWEGPISLLTLQGDKVVVQAKDVMYYVQRTVERSGYDNSYPNVVSVLQRAKNILQGELARKEALTPPINVLPYVTLYSTAGDARTSKVTAPYSTTAFTDIDDMAARSGLDYTVVGRRILLFDTHAVFYTTPVMTDADFTTDLIISSYGTEGATFAAVADSTGHYGTYGGTDPYYGLWEILDTAYEEGSPNDAPTTAELTSQAQRNLNGRNPVPTIVRVPDNSQLSPLSALKMRDLVPGARIPLRATLTARTLTQMQKLDHMRVTEDATGEKVMVTMSAATNDDAAAEEGS